MSYLRQALRFRYPVTVANDGSSTVDVEITVPPRWDHFWGNIRSDAFDVILTAADGVTVLDFQRSSFNLATRTLVLQVGAFPVLNDADTESLIWLYYGDAAATDEAGTPVIGATVNGVVYLGQPTVPRIDVTRRPRATLSDIVDKSTDEIVYIWFHIGQLLERQRHPDGGSITFEEVKDVRVQVIEDGAVRPGMAGLVSKFALDQSDRLWVGAGVQAGISDQDFTVSVRIGTEIPSQTNHRVLNPRALLRVRDLTED